MKRVIGARANEEERQLLGRIDAWYEAGGQRLDADGDNLYEHGAAVSLFDHWWPLFVRAYQSGEMSQNAGGLVRWPVWLLMPVGFAILLAQCASELIKRVAFLTGHRAEPFSTPSGSAEPRPMPVE